MSKSEFLGQMSGMIEEAPGSLTGSEKLDDLPGWDSVAMMSFIAFVDEHFHVTLSPRQFTNAETVNDLAKLIGIEGD